MPNKMFFKAILLAAVSVFAAGQEQPTPYDLIRPVWPLTWDESVFDNFDTNVTVKKNMVPKNRTPTDYAPNEFIPDTLNQAYLDNMNTHISRIRVNQAGYLTDDLERLFYYVGSETEFEVVDIEGKSLSPAVTGTLSPLNQTVSSKWHINAGTNAATNDKNRYTVTAVGPSGPLMKGSIPQGLPSDTRLRIKVGNDISSTFIISDRVYSMVQSAALKFYGINRSGEGHSWFHPASHMKDGAGAVVEGPQDVREPYNAAMAGTLQGGYYDCGDHLKEALTQMYAFMVAALMSAANPENDEDNYAFDQSETINKDGIPDILREAKHGADFVLRSYIRAKGVIDDMALSIGSYGSDHGWWGRPENQDNLPVDGSAAATGRGGPGARPVRLSEIGANVGGETVAGLALLSKTYREFDPDFADSCLMVARKMYDFAKSLVQNKGSYDGGKTFVHHGKATNPEQPSSAVLAQATPAYSGNNEYIDDMALASVALWYATGESQYGDDAIRGKNMYNNQQYGDGAGFFEGGWFVTTDKGFLKNQKNTSWANSYSYALYALYKLILQDKEKALSVYGLTETEWLNAIEDCVANMILNIGDLNYHEGRSTETLVLPSVPSVVWKSSSVSYDAIWFTMYTDQTWIYNRYRLGDAFEILAYAEVADDIEKKGIALPIMGTPDWKAAEAKQFGINQLNYLLGVNPWDVSFIMGVGDKNDAHPHHRAANPEGTNVPGAPYKYRPPVGGLYGAEPPSLDAVLNSSGPLAHVSGDGGGGGGQRSWEYYQMSELCIDAAASLVSVVNLAAKKIDRSTAPQVSVEIRHVSMDSAIIFVKLSSRGSVDILYGTDGESFPNTASSAESGVAHEIVLRGLTPGTMYNFYVKGYNAYKPENFTEKYMVDSTKTPFSFSTLNMIDAADIQNITVCNVHADSAEIMWYTPNGEYESKIYWDTVPHTNANEYAFNSGSKNADVSGIPTKFHYVKIGGLKERTTYYYMVESNGMQVNVDRETNQPLKFKTPVMQYDFSVKTYQYYWQDMAMMNINVYNNESRPFDSLTIRLYMRGTEDIKTDIGMGTDICNDYDEAGFNNKCTDETKAQLELALRNIKPEKIEDTYDAVSGTWQWFFPLELGSTVIKSSSRLRFDVRFDHRSPYPPYQDLMSEAPDKKLYCLEGGKWYAPSNGFAGALTLNENPGDWSWMPHSKVNGEYADYPGMPCVTKDEGDLDFDVAPVNPYVSVYRKDEFVWGYSPSRGEMETKRANYKLSVTLDPPFDVSNGSYIELDQTSSTVYATGHAHITEGGYITKIWANGQLVTGHADIFGNEKIVFNAAGTDIVAQYNIATGLWDLKIPVKMSVGSNKVDITIFAGPNPTCDVCMENGGCAFENRTYYVQFTRGNLTQSALTIRDAAGNPVASPAEPGATSFNIFLRDMDKAKYTDKIHALVINAKKNDTLVVELVPDANNPGSFHSANLISAVNVAKDNRNKSTEISFFPGDTIHVLYIDPDDEEDVSKQSFFAESHNPEPQVVFAQDTDCDGVTDQLLIKFSNAFDDNYTFDNVRVFINGMLDTATVPVTSNVTGLSEVVVPLTGLSIPVTQSPFGKATLAITTEGATSYTSINITDGILPNLMSVTILENPNHESELDTVMIAFSEPVIIANEMAWPIATNGESGTITVVGKPTTLNDGMSWQYVISGNEKGKVLPVGGTAYIAADVVITDKALNALIPGGGCTPTVTIAETPKPVPVTLAEMRDFEGDGYPDELYIKFKKHLRNKDMLDSFVVDWGYPSIIKSFITRFDSSTGVIVPLDDFWTISDSISDPRTVQITADSSAIVIDTVSIIKIKITTSMSYPLGATSGAYANQSGYYGTVVPRLGPVGGFFDKDYPVVDACPPIVVKAVKEIDGKLSRLTVTFSEPLVTLPEETLHYLERKRGSNAGVYMLPQGVTTIDETKTLYVYDDESEFAVNVGDFVRFDTNAVTSHYKDFAGNYPTRYNPWVKVVGSSAEKTRFTVTLANPVTTILPGVDLYTPLTQPLENEVLRLTVLNRDGSESLVDLNSGTFGLPMGTGYVHGGPVFQIKISMPAAQMVDKVQNYLFDMLISIKVNLFDNIGQYIAGKKIEIDMASHPEWRSAVGDDGILNLNLEWLAHDGEAPISEKGKKLGTGAYISKFDFKAIQTCTEDYEETDGISCTVGKKEKVSDNSTKSFGFKRAKRK